jgi:hypothetical protein
VDDPADEFGTQLVPETQLGAGLELSSPEDSSNDSSESIFSQSLTKITEINVEPRRSGRATRPTRDLASQMSQEAAAAKEKAACKTNKGKGKGKERAEAKGSGKGRRRKLRKSIPTSQLLDEFSVV